MITPLDFNGNCLCGNEKMKRKRIYNCAHDSLSFFSRWKFSSYSLYSCLVFPAAIENEIVSGAISSLSLLPTHG